MLSIGDQLLYFIERIAAVAFGKGLGQMLWVKPWVRTLVGVGGVLSITQPITPLPANHFG